MQSLAPLFTLAAVTFSTSVATADSSNVPEPTRTSNVYASVSGLASVDQLFRFGMAAEAGKRMEGTPVFVRGLVGGGDATDWSANGTYTTVRLGVEARGCFLRQWVCGFGGVDVGATHDRMTDDDTQMTRERTNPLFVPRVAIQAGKRLHARAAFELPMSPSRDQSVGAAASLGVGYAF